MKQNQAADIEPFLRELTAEAHRILGFWTDRMVDRDQGGFYGRIDGYGDLHPRADKGVILNTRILWSFSAAARRFGESGYREAAERAFRYLLDCFLDEAFGGVYWMLDYRGRPVVEKKQIYAQAFAVYALAEYFRLTGAQEALRQAIDLYRLVERHSFDPVEGGYLEAFSRRWTLLDDLRLSEKEINEKKTMNTHLHVMEAYANLSRVWPDEGLRQRLAGLVRLFLDRIIDPATGHLRLFFTERWEVRSQIVSYGHDIEAAWLLSEAAGLAGDPELTERVSTLAVRIAAVTLTEGTDADGGLYNEAEAGVLTHPEKDWWPQAEAMVGFCNAWQLTGEPRFREAARRSWSFIQRYLIDREQGEWHWGVTREGSVRREEDKAGPWKAPYHNTRACLEMMERVEGRR